MKRLNVITCFWLILAAAQHGAAQSRTAAKNDRPEDVVHRLYRQVIRRQPLGLPTGLFKKSIWPLISKRLIHQLETAQLCGLDEARQLQQEEETQRRQHPDQARHIFLKPEVAWLEFGLFSGGNEEASPPTATVEKAVPQPDGSYQVLTKLTFKPLSATYRRFIAAIVTLEGGNYVVDDVVFFRENSTHVELRLSDLLSEGCDGPKWVGYAGDHVAK